MKTLFNSLKQLWQGKQRRSPIDQTVATHVNEATPTPPAAIVPAGASVSIIGPSRKRSKRLLRNMARYQSMRLPAASSLALVHHVEWAMLHLWTQEQGDSYLKVVRQMLDLQHGKRRPDAQTNLENSVEEQKRAELLSTMLVRYQELWEHFTATAKVYRITTWQELRHRCQVQDMSLLSPNRFLGEGATKLEQALHRLGDEHYVSDGEDFLVLDGDWKWVKIASGRSAQEAMAMAHCGNMNRLGTTMYSLRQRVVIKNQELWKPHLTFIAEEGCLIEMKGYANSRPQRIYHPQILRLLLHDEINSLNTNLSSYSGNDFSLLDFDEESLQLLLRQKPSLSPIVIIGEPLGAVLKRNHSWVRSDTIIALRTLDAMPKDRSWFTVEKFPEFDEKLIVFNGALQWDDTIYHVCLGTLKLWSNGEIGDRLYTSTLWTENVGDFDYHLLTLLQDSSVRFSSFFRLEGLAFMELNDPPPLESPAIAFLREEVPRNPHRFGITQQRETEVVLRVNERLWWGASKNEANGEWETANWLSLVLWQSFPEVAPDTPPIPVAKLLIKNGELDPPELLRLWGDKAIAEGLVALLQREKISVRSDDIEVWFASLHHESSHSPLQASHLRQLLKERPSLCAPNVAFRQPWWTSSTGWRWTYLWSKPRHVKDSGILLDPHYSLETMPFLQLEHEIEADVWIPIFAFQYQWGDLTRLWPSCVLAPLILLHDDSARPWLSYAAHMFRVFKEDASDSVSLPPQLEPQFGSRYQKDLSEIKAQIVKLLQHPAVTGYRLIPHALTLMNWWSGDAQAFHLPTRKALLPQGVSPFAHVLGSKGEAQTQALAQALAFERTLDGLYVMLVIPDPFGFFLHDYFRRLFGMRYADVLHSYRFICEGEIMPHDWTPAWAQDYLRARATWHELQEKLVAWVDHRLGYSLRFDPEVPWRYPAVLCMNEKQMVDYCLSLEAHTQTAESQLEEGKSPRFESILSLTLLADWNRFAQVFEALGEAGTLPEFPNCAWIRAMRNTTFGGTGKLYNYLVGSEIEGKYLLPLMLAHMLRLDDFELRPRFR